MQAASHIGHGTDLKAVWNGAPASFRGAPTSAAISTAVLCRNLRVVSMACSGSKIVSNGWTARASLPPA